MNQLAKVIMHMTKLNNPSSITLARELTLVYRPGASFAIGRRGVAPSQTEIRIVVREAKAAGLALHESPTLRVAGDWHVAEWKLEKVQL